MYKLDKRKFGSFVSSLRKEKGWTQKELAQRLFVSDKAVSKWETGASIPDTALLIPLAEQLGVSVTELLRCDGPAAPAGAASVASVPVSLAVRGACFLSRRSIEPVCRDVRLR